MRFSGVLRLFGEKKWRESGSEVAGGILGGDCLVVLLPVVVVYEGIYGEEKRRSFAESYGGQREGRGSWVFSGGQWSRQQQREKKVKGRRRPVVCMQLWRRGRRIFDEEGERRPRRGNGDEKNGGRRYGGSPENGVRKEKQRGVGGCC
ncbi:hypothetical protein HAX54_037487 [Datura stramonium]|uniref:Uncharacterized protein n=1 Tax=Datura stramonium TaxID=4076 RepID=A0ABS8VLL3_DATST|nr:hypothetical protein [Datura stramonium]